MSQDVFGVAAREGSVEALTELIADLIGTAAKLHLYKSSFSPSPANVYADFLAAEADFVGYSAASLTFGSVGLDAAGNAVSYGDRVEFVATDGTTPNTIGGCYVSVETATTPSVVNKALRYYPFPSPIPMSTALATLAAVVMYQAQDLTGKVIIDS